jgi:ubiquinone/menaquinone biosynthesis C-methylase UbiE
MAVKSHFMDYQSIGKEARSLYDKSYSRIYRESDRAEIAEPFHKDMTRKLRDMSGSFSRPIDVLDIGCGTGRYFYSLVGVKSLTGIDVSEDMLLEAKNPIRKEEIRAGEIKLICGDILQYSFPDASFDFIYSIGVLGEHSPFDAIVCKKIYHMLRPKGKALITIVDAQSMWKRKLAEILYPVLPKRIKEKLHNRRKSFYMYRPQVEALLQQSDFDQYHIARTVSKSPKWRGAHFECVLTKD